MNAEYSDIYNHNEANLSLVSIIMPVYNTPINNLMNSVSSIINQTYKAIELIIVDDGSSLECAKVCDDLAERDARICVIHQNNNGVSMARNKGLDVAKGEWIMFADADDVYYPSAVERGVSLAMEYELDIVYAEVVYVGFDGKREFRKFEISKPGSLEIISERDSLHSLAIYFIASRIIPFSVIPNNLSSGPWSRIFRASTIGACRFDQRLKILEDALFNSSVVLNATKIGFVCEPWYEYYQYIGSALHRMTFENESELHCNIIRDYVAMHSLSIDAYYYHACSYFFFAMRSSSPNRQR